MIALVAALLAQPMPLTRPPETATTQAPAETPVTKAARDFLALVDANKWPESFAMTGQSFQTLNTVATWQAASEKVRAQFGPALSRTLVDDYDVPAPPSGARIVRFRTDFANKRGATETLSLNREGDEWRVVGIYVE